MHWAVNTHQSATYADGIALHLWWTGAIVSCPQDTAGEMVAGISAVTEHEGKLYLGNLKQNYLAVYDLKHQ